MSSQDPAITNQDFPFPGADAAGSSQEQSDRPLPDDEAAIPASEADELDESRPRESKQDKLVYRQNTIANLSGG